MYTDADPFRQNASRPPSRPAVFLDRDGVINRVVLNQGRPAPPASVADTVLESGVVAGLSALKAAGFCLIVVTNQPDVARGTRSRESVEAIHRWMFGQLPLDDIRACFHDDADQCDCRKPKPGLVLDAARDHAIDLPASYLVGDRWRDVEAAHRAGCKAVFIDHGYAERQPGPDCARFRSFAEACDWILRDVQVSG
jgi:D-glycero-D-manno-heptose 1,7-bisphosphate phosphatase